MRPARSTIILLALLLANALVILCFRFFITVDGPMHVLHASLLDALWTTPGHLAHGITYDSAALQGWLGDRILSVLLLFATPEQAHDLFAALVSCATVLSVVAFLRAYGTRMSVSILWLVPLTFSFVLIMGLFHFLLGVAVSFASVAWWKWQEPAPRIRWAGFVIGGLTAWYTHRSAPVLLCVLFLVAFAIELHGKRSLAKSVKCRSPLLHMAIIGAVLLVVALAVGRIVVGIPLPLPHDLPLFNEDLLLRPLLLLDPERERWLVRAIAALLLIPICAGAWVRMRMGRRLFPQDVPLVFILVFQLIAWLGNTPHGHQLLIAERCQWLALVAVVMWLVTMADRHRGLASKLIGISVLFVLPLHVVRMVQAESALLQFQSPHHLAIGASAALAPGSLVMPVTAGRTTLLQHVEAYIAVRHSGVLLAASERIRIKNATAVNDVRLHRMTGDPYWIARHWRKRIPEGVDEILFIGDDIERIVEQHPWPLLLKEHYQITFKNGYTRIYTAGRSE